MRWILLRGITAACFGLTLLAQPLKIYTEIFPPDQYLGPDGTLTGYAVEIVQEIQARTGHRDPIQLVPWAKGYRDARQQPNVVLFSMARLPEREALFHWLGPIKDSCSVLYVRKDSGLVVTNLEQARRLKRIGVYRDDARDEYLTRAGFTNLDRSVDQAVILRKLLAGRIDAMASVPDAMPDLLRSMGVEPERIRPACSFLEIPICIALSRSTPPAIVEAWTEALNAMKRDGSFRRIYRKYYPQRPLP